MTSSVCNCVVEMATTRWRERIEDIRVPDTDTRKYRYLELLNRLKVVLISDEEAKKGAAALTVQAGESLIPFTDLQCDRAGLRIGLTIKLYSCGLICCTCVGTQVRGMRISFAKYARFTVFQ